MATDVLQVRTWLGEGTKVVAVTYEVPSLAILAPEVERWLNKVGEADDPHSAFKQQKGWRALLDHCVESILIGTQQLDFLCR